jgi:hypothetical protein
MLLSLTASEAKRARFPHFVSKQNASTVCPSYLNNMQRESCEDDELFDSTKGAKLDKLSYGLPLKE